MLLEGLFVLLCIGAALVILLGLYQGTEYMRDYVKPKPLALPPPPTFKQWSDENQGLKRDFHLTKDEMLANYLHLHKTQLPQVQIEHEIIKEVIPMDTKDKKEKVTPEQRKKDLAKAGATIGVKVAKVIEAVEQKTTAFTQSKVVKETTAKMKEVTGNIGDWLGKGLVKIGNKISKKPTQAKE